MKIRYFFFLIASILILSSILTSIQSYSDEGGTKATGRIILTVEERNDEAENITIEEKTDEGISKITGMAVQEIEEKTNEAGFFTKIIGFFKKLFGAS